MTSTTKLVWFLRLSGFVLAALSFFGFLNLFVLRIHGPAGDLAIVAGVFAVAASSRRAGRNDTKCPFTHRARRAAGYSGGSAVGGRLASMHARRLAVDRAERLQSAPMALPPRCAGPGLAGRGPLPRGGKTVSARTLAPLDHAASTDAVGRHLPGALMRRWWRGIYANHTGGTRREESRRRFSGCAARASLQGPVRPVPALRTVWAPPDQRRRVPVAVVARGLLGDPELETSSDGAVP